MGSAPGVDRRSLAVLSFAHFGNDLFAFALPALMPLLIDQLSLSLVLVGVVFTAFQITSSIAQPYFGHLADRTAPRWFAWGGLAAIAIAGSIIGVAPNFAVLLLAALVAGFGSAAFHPVSAAMVNALASPRNRGMLMSIYITAGNIGLGVGPLLLGLLLKLGGLPLTPLLGLPALAGALLLYRFPPASYGRRASRAGLSLQETIRLEYRLLPRLLGVVIIRTIAFYGVTTFLPKLFVDRGWDVSLAATVLSVILVTGAFGGLVGGALSDRVGRLPIIVGSLLVSPLPLWLLIHSEGAMVWAGAGLTGFILSGSFNAITVYAQERLPGSVALVSGLMLGFTIGVGGLAVTPLAAAVERVGAEAVMTAMLPLPVLAALLALTARRRSQLATVGAATG